MDPVYQMVLRHLKVAKKKKTLHFNILDTCMSIRLSDRGIHYFSLIFDKIDKDNNKEVSEEELRNWIRYVQNKYINDDTTRQWAEHELNDAGHLTWDIYKKRTYGYLEGVT